MTSAFEGFDWNGGIRGRCEFCAAPGFIYNNRANGYDIEMCDACRDDLERRKQFVATRTERAAVSSSETT